MDPIAQIYSKPMLGGYRQGCKQMGGGWADNLRKMGIPLWKKIKEGVSSDSGQAVINKMTDISQEGIKKLIDKIPSGSAPKCLPADKVVRRVKRSKRYKRNRISDVLGKDSY